MLELQELKHLLSQPREVGKGAKMIYKRTFKIGSYSNPATFRVGGLFFLSEVSYES